MSAFSKRIIICGTDTDVGKTIVCNPTMVSMPCFYPFCTNGPTGKWLITHVLGTINPYLQCTDMTYSTPCPVGCATPHQLSYQSNDGYYEWPGPGASPAPPEHMQSQNAIDEQKIEEIESQK